MTATRNMNPHEDEHRAKVRALAPGCAVLLRSNGDFPLDAPGELALYGGGARHTVMGGTGSGEVNARCFVSAEEGLRCAGFTVKNNAVFKSSRADAFNTSGKYCFCQSGTASECAGSDCQHITAESNFCQA